jgi:hypothetical protein
MTDDELTYCRHCVFDIRRSGNQWIMTLGGASPEACDRSEDGKHEPPWSYATSGFGTGGNA